mgnify:FL=1
MNPIKTIWSVLGALAILTTASTFSAHHEKGEAKAMTIVGSYITEGGKTNPLYAGDITKQRIWLDYIDAHNDRDLEKISGTNADDWEGYVDDGAVIKGNEAHMTFLDEWFKSSANPNWTVRWMIANGGENDDGVGEDWLTTGNDITFLDDDGNEVKQHHVHDVQFAGNKIKRINVYSRSAPAE